LDDVVRYGHIDQRMHRFFAEFFATFALVFAGTSAIVVDHLTGGAISHVGIALTFGLVVAAMIYAVGDVSGAHLNPAVTLGFWLARRLPAADVAPYVLSQVAQPPRGKSFNEVMKELADPVVDTTLGAQKPMTLAEAAATAITPDNDLVG
jgi:hypothetical protein